MGFRSGRSAAGLGDTGESQDQDGLWNSTITVRDPCLPPDPGTGPPPPGDGTSCGDLSAALQGFRFRSLEGGEEIEELRLAMGQFGIGQALVVGTEGSSLLPAGVQAAPRREIVEIRSLARSASGTIEWNFQSWAQDARRTFRAAQGTILTGRSLVNPGWRVGLVSEPKTFGRRDPAPQMLSERLGSLSPQAKHQVLAGGALGFYGLS